jgi:hypothetical protein
MSGAMRVMNWTVTQG